MSDRSRSGRRRPALSADRVPVSEQGQRGLDSHQQGNMSDRWRSRQRRRRAPSADRVPVSEQEQLGLDSHQKGNMSDRSRSRRRRRRASSADRVPVSEQEQRGLDSHQHVKQVFELVCEIAIWMENDVTLGDIINTQRIRVDNEAQLLSFLKKQPSMFSLSTDYNARGREIWRVQPKTQAAICEKHCSRPGICSFDCEKLHVCKFFLLGNCKFSGEEGPKPCNFGHDLHDAHNQSVLRANMLDGLSDEQIKFIFQGVSNRCGRTLPAICRFYNVGRDGCRNTANRKPCPHLHICRHYVMNTCKFGRKCMRSHHFETPQLRQLLAKHGLAQTPTTQLVTLLQDNLDSEEEPQRAPLSRAMSTPRPVGISSFAIPALVPSQVRVTPSTSTGPGNGYNRGAMSAYGSGGGGMPSHGTGNPGIPLAGLSYQGGAKLKTIGINSRTSSGRPTVAENIQRSTAQLRRVDGHLSAGDPSRSLSRTDDDPVDICTFFLRRRCKFIQGCFNHHPSSNLPYQWQTSDTSQASVWDDVAPILNAKLEKPFSDANIGDLTFQAFGRTFCIYFDTFELKEGDQTSPFGIRRISTKSTQDPSQNALSIEWKWYWKDNDGSWIIYGQKGENDSQSSLRDSDIEGKFLENPKGTFAFTVGHYEYDLNLGTIVQKNERTGTERAVRRRPVFLTTNEWTENGKKAKFNAPGTRNDVSVPSSWKKDASYDDSYCKVELEKSGQTLKEYDEIEQFFLGKINNPRMKVNAIYRIQNPEALDRFESKKKWMAKKSGITDPSKLEKRLFHGTRKEFVEAICQQGFDWRMYGSSTGSKFGKGSYFALNADYSTAYSDNNDMFVVRVLVGDYAAGSPTYRRPPPKDSRKPTGHLFDSCTDRVDAPTMFVVFTLEQAYPEYLVHFETSLF